MEPEAQQDAELQGPMRIPREALSTYIFVITVMVQVDIESKVIEDVPDGNLRMSASLKHGIQEAMDWPVT